MWWRSFLRWGTVKVTNAPQKMWWRSFLRWGTVKVTNAPQKMWWRSFLRWGTVKVTNAPQKMWWRSFLRWGTVKVTNAPQKMWWRSFLRWGTVKETNAPQKILMIRFENKTWLMENQVKLSCFRKCSSGDITAVIRTLTWSKSVQIWHNTITLKELLLNKTLLNYQSDDRRHEEIDHVDHLKTLETHDQTWNSSFIGLNTAAEFKHTEQGDYEDRERCSGISRRKRKWCRKPDESAGRW